MQRVEFQDAVALYHQQEGSMNAVVSEARTLENRTTARQWITAIVAGSLIALALTAFIAGVLPDPAPLEQAATGGRLHPVQSYVAGPGSAGYTAGETVAREARVDAYLAGPGHPGYTADVVPLRSEPSLMCGLSAPCVMP